jgi:hypothetical protein
MAACAKGLRSLESGTGAKVKIMGEILMMIE